MAVTPKEPPMLKRFWPRYSKRAVLLTIVMQVVVVLFVGIALIIAGFNPDSFAFWIVLLATAATSLGLNILLITQLLVPLKDLSAALTHVSGEPSTVIPPNPNARRFEANGMKPLLQHIYESAAGSDDEPAPKSGKSQAMLEKALEETRAGLVVMNAHGEILYANRQAPVVIGDSDSTQKLELLFEKPEEFSDWLKNCRDNAVHSEKTWRRVPNRIVGEDDRRIFDIVATYEKGSVAEVVLVAFDQSAVYQPEDDELDFIAFAAHELRGPITVIRGYLDVLEMEVGPGLESDQQELIKRLVVSANRLSGYINNILNASRFDRRHFKVHLVEESLASIYDTINDDMQLRAQAQNRLLAVNIPADLPTVAADRSSLSEVLGNLIDNALKYSNEGGAVNVTAAVEGGYVKVSVEDHGIGMPGNVVGNLFHKFYRSHRSRETVAGTGIGLYISKAIVESHGGTIGVKSTEGDGSTFTFTVPIYDTVKDKLQASDFSNAGFIKDGNGWIKNHSMYKG